MLFAALLPACPLLRYRFSRLDHHLNNIYGLARSTSLSPAQVPPKTLRTGGGLRVGSSLALATAVWIGGSDSAWSAGACPVAADSTVTVSGMMVGTSCTVESGVQLIVDPSAGLNGQANRAVSVQSGTTGAGISNNGLLTSSSDATLWNAGGISQLVNAGSITNSSDDGIFNSGTIGLLNNTSTGAINADFWGIWNTGTITELRNAGTISGVSGLVMHGDVATLNNTGELLGTSSAVNINHLATIPTFNNSGLIRGGAGGAGAFAINNDGALGTLNNSGWIDGRFWSSKAVTLNLQGSSARISGPVVNPGGSVNIESGAEFSTESWFESGTFSIHSGGWLNVASPGHELVVSDVGADAFSNAGTMYVPDGVQANIIGNYRQSGLLHIGASGTSSFGSLYVEGNADFTPDARFAVDVNSVTSLATGETLTGVVTASGTLTNQAGGQAVQDNSALFDFEIDGVGNSINLRVVAEGTSGTSQGIVAMVRDNGLPRGVPAAEVLNNYIRGGHTGTDWDVVVTSLGQLPTGQSVALAVGQMLPLLHGGAALAGLGSGSVASTTISQQQALAGRSGGDGSTGSRPWVRPLGGWLDQDTVDGASGYEFNSYGLLGGIQSDISGTSMVGVGAGYLRSKFKGKGYAATHLAEMESVQVIGYGRYGLNGGWNLDWQGDYTRGRVDFTRGLTFINRVAEGEYNSDAWHLGAGLSKSLSLSDSTTVSPGMALDWRRLRSDAYTEKGAGVLNLHVQKTTAEEAVLKFGAQLQHKTSERLQWMISAALGYDLKGDDSRVVARFTGGGPAFAIDGVSRGRKVAELGMGMSYRSSETTEFNARYELLVRQGLREQRASVRFSWLF